MLHLSPRKAGPLVSNLVRRKKAVAAIQGAFMQHAKPISDLVVQRWKDAGAVLGWQDQWGYFSEAKCEDDDLPAFLFDNNWLREKLCDLLDAEVPFGVQLAWEANDNDLNQLSALQSLETFCVGLTKITDHGVKELVTLSKLRRIKIGGCAIGDESLKHLGKLVSLEVLDVGFTQITDAGLIYLRTLTELTYLNLKQTLITDSGLKHLAALTKCGGSNLAIQKSPASDSVI